MGDIVAGIDVVDRLPSETLPPVETNYGLVLPADEGFVWVCHEALTEPKAVVAPAYDRSTEGVWLANLPDATQGRGGHTLFRSPDGGCTWNDVSGIDAGVQVRDAQFDRGAPLLALAVTNTPGTANTIYASGDGGASWAAVVPAVDDRLFHTTGFRGGQGYATATDAAGTRAFWWFPDDKGDWQEREVAVPKGISEARFAVLDARDDVVWAVIDPVGDDIVLTSNDGGESWVTALTDAGNANDGQLVGDDLWLLLNNGIELAVVSPDGTVDRSLTEYVPSFGLMAEGDDLWFAALSFAVGPLLARADRGGNFSVIAYPDDVSGPLTCPAGTHVADVCAPLWATLEPQLRGFDTPTESTATGDTGGLIDDPFEDDQGCKRTEDQGCGCAPNPTGTGAAWLLLLAVGAARRSR